MNRLRSWLKSHPGKAGAIAGWYQQFASGIVVLALIPVVENEQLVGVIRSVDAFHEITRIIE